GSVERVRPQDIRTSALLTIEGELDDISGSGQTEAAHELCTGVQAGSRKHIEVKGAGHYGIFSGRRWRDLVYPQVKAFITAHDQPQKHRSGRSSVSSEDNVQAAPESRARATAVAAENAAARPARKSTAATPRKKAAAARR
ncbi:MAG: polyhydroxyalkanoate depolymerase, partial [Proteobacteria bacterium]|nr:polyhydroxyalkanoate depolymerase [Pseudomonadota bacterium]